MSKKILNIATFGLAGAILGGGKKKDKTPPPPPAAPAVMPTPDDAQIMQARKRAIAGQLSRRGRASTILSQPPGSTLGG